MDAPVQAAAAASPTPPAALAAASAAAAAPLVAGVNPPPAPSTSPLGRQVAAVKGVASASAVSAPAKAADPAASATTTALAENRVEMSKGVEDVALDTASPATKPAPAEAEASDAARSPPTDGVIAPQPGAPALAAQTPPAVLLATASTASNLAAAMVKKIEARSSRFELELDPAGLGRVKVSVQIDAQGRLAAQLSFDRPDAASALKGRADELRTALQNAGFDLGGAGLSFTSSDNPRSGGQMADTSQQQQRADQAARLFARGAEAAEAADRSTPAYARRAASGALDLLI